MADGRKLRGQPITVDIVEGDGPPRPGGVDLLAKYLVRKHKAERRKAPPMKVVPAKES